MTKASLALMLIALAPAGAFAQHGSPYLEQQQAGARGLSSQEIDDLTEGRGMGLARAAELNGYPGPRHVLDAARNGQLALTPEQQAGVQRVYDAMEREARRLGARVVADEQALEAAFRGGGLTDTELSERVTRLAAMHGELRQVHLRAHLETRALLTDAQIARYDEVRGYSSSAPTAHTPHRH
jgi:LTXXQ motif family protein